MLPECALSGTEVAVQLVLNHFFLLRIFSTIDRLTGRNLFIMEDWVERPARQRRVSTVRHSRQSVEDKKVNSQLIQDGGSGLERTRKKMLSKQASTGMA